MRIIKLFGLLILVVSSSPTISLSSLNFPTTKAGIKNVLAANGCTAHRIYLPLITRGNEPQYFEGPWEVEINNSYDQANGPIRSGLDYYGYPNDWKDYYSFYLPVDGPINISLSGNLGQGVQLQLFYQSVINRIDYDPFAPFQLSHNGKAGWYYIYIFTKSGFNSNAPYTLRATYPSQSLGSTDYLLSRASDSDLPSIGANWVGYNFEESIEDWVTSEGAYKLASLSTSTQQAYQGVQSLKLRTELCGQTDFLYRHTEATAYFTSAVPQGMDTLGPYDLTDHQVSCYVYLPAELVSTGNPQAYVRIFVKDEQFRNQFSELVNITAANAESWINLSLAIGNDNADPNFDPTRVNMLGLRFELYSDATLNFNGDIFIDECSISESAP